jgi:hypothetical protein
MSDRPFAFTVAHFIPVREIPFMGFYEVERQRSQQSLEVRTVSAGNSKCGIYGSQIPIVAI